MRAILSDRIALPSSPREYQAAALWKVAWAETPGDLTGALTLLEGARDDEVVDEIDNLTVVALVLRAEMGGRPADYYHAADVLERLVRRGSTSSVARFNQPLVLQRVGLVEIAREARQEFSGDWAWQSELDEMLSPDAPAAGQSDASVRLDAAVATLLALGDLDHLPSGLLETADVLARDHADPWLDQEVALIQLAAPAERETLLEAYAALARARAPAMGGSPEVAALAVRRLREAGSNLYELGLIRVADAWFRVGDFARARGVVAQIQSGSFSRGVQLRAFSLQALMAALAGDYAIATAAYESWLVGAAEWGSEVAEVAARFRLAALQRQAGFLADAWATIHVAAGFASSRGSRNGVELDLALATMCGDMGWNSIAVRFASRSSAAAASVGLVAHETYALMERGRLRLGSPAEALAFLQASRDSAARLPDPIAASIGYEVDVVEAEMSVDEDPAAALALARSVQAANAATAISLKLVRTKSIEAAALENLGANLEAFAAAKQALAALDLEMANVVGRPERAGLARRSRSLTDRALRVGLELESTPEQLLELVELHRLRAGARSIAYGPGAAGPAAALDPHDLPDDAAVLVYWTSASTTYIWRLVAGRIDLAIVPVGRGQVERQIELLRAAAYANDENRASTVAAQLHQTLIESAGYHLDDGRLVVVPDESVAGLPFAAMQTPTGVPLGARVEVALASDTQTAISWLSSRWEASQSSTLLVDASNLGSEHRREFGSLYGATAEIDALQAVYETARVLRNEGASRQQVIAALPDYDTIHIAGHAENATPESPFGRLVLPLGEEISSDELVSARTDRGPVVFLSACHAGAGTAPGARGVGGLASGILGAGARAVIASPWRVRDDLAIAIAERFHRNLAAGMNPSRALATAQRRGVAGGLSWLDAYAYFVQIGRDRTLPISFGSP
jgi:CHAT domain-containing protein